MGSFRKAQRGFTLIEVMVVVAILSILASITFSLYANTQQRARIAKVQGDVQTIASAVSLYQAHTGAMPPALATLTAVALDAAGRAGGPFLGVVPSPPAGGSPAWAAYGFTDNGNGTFSISATGDGTTITRP